jgi:hypothetical protein
MNDDSTYTVLPEISDSGSLASHVANICDMFKSLDEPKRQGKKKKKNKKKGKKKSKKSDKKYKGKKGKKSRKSEKAKSKTRAKWEMWLRAIEKSIDSVRETTLETASYVVKRHYDYKWPVNDPKSRISKV